MPKRSFPPLVRLVCIASGALAALGCAEAPSNPFSQAPSEPTAVESFEVFRQIPACDHSRKGQVYYVRKDEQFYYCDGRHLRRIDLSGEPGPAGISWITVTSSAGPADCPNGGILIHVGPDTDRDGVLDASEITSTDAVCNGADGEDGAPGADGEDGAAAGNPLVRVTIEPPGVHCPTGGNLIEVGLDANDDGELSDEEVTGADYACHSGSGVRALAVGALHACALLDDGSVKCWGFNDYGQLGLGDMVQRGDEPGEMAGSLPSVNLGSGRKARALSAGTMHTCALLDDASVKCWGNNFFGQLGLSDTENRGDEPGEMGDDLPSVSLGSGRTAVALNTSGGDAEHTCALLDDGSAKCWGYNISGQLGQGDTNWRGDEPGEMGDDLPSLSLGSGRSAVALATTTLHTCALLDDGSVKCWGSSGDGQLGLGDTITRGDEPGEMGDDLPAVSLGTDRTALALSAEALHTCVILDDGNVKCWGYNGLGGLGLGDALDRGDEPGEMGDDLPVVSLGTDRTALALSVGAHRSCAILDDGSVKCWGYSPLGELGLGDTITRGDGPGEMGDDLPAVSLGTDRTALALSAGSDTTCALLDDSHAKCWGYNGFGQLGLGDTLDRGDEPGEMGDSLPAVPIAGIP